MNEHTLATEHFRPYRNGGQVEIDCMKTARICRAGVSAVEIKDGHLHIDQSWFAQGEPFPIPSGYRMVRPDYARLSLKGCEADYAENGRLKVTLPEHHIELIFCAAGDEHNIRPETLEVEQVI